MQSNEHPPKPIKIEGSTVGDTLDAERLDGDTPEELKTAAVEQSTGIMDNARARGEQVAHAFARGIEFVTRRNSRETPSRLMGDAAKPITADVASYRSARDSASTPVETRFGLKGLEALFTGLSLPPAVLEALLAAGKKLLDKIGASGQDAKNKIERL